MTHVGGPAPGGKRWMLELGAVIDSLQHGAGRFYVSRGSQQIGLSVQRGELVAMTGDDWSVNSLPACVD